jgi:amidohydrolase
MEIGPKPTISENPGVCHACGHDGHTAILMGTANILAQHRHEFAGKVVFLFQPSEEKFPGGAKRMIEEGALAGVDAIFGLHLWQSLPTGKVVSLNEPMMAAPDRFEIKVTGRGGHGSAPHLTVDPILIAAHIVIDLQSIVSRNVDPQRPAVLTVSTISGGSAFNIIPCEASLTGTVRTFDPAVQDLIERRIHEIAAGTCATFQASSQVNYVRGHPAVINDPKMTAIVHEAACAALGEGSVANIPPVMGGEDFAFYLKEIPGAFILFGMGDGTSYPHHHPGFDMDEKALPQATALMSSLAMHYLSRG